MIANSDNYPPEEVARLRVLAVAQSRRGDTAGADRILAAMMGNGVHSDKWIRDHKPQKPEPVVIEPIEVEAEQVTMFEPDPTDPFESEFEYAKRQLQEVEYNTTAGTTQSLVGYRTIIQPARFVSFDRSAHVVKVALPSGLFEIWRHRLIAFDLERILRRETQQAIKIEFEAVA